MSILEVNNVSIRYMTGDFKEIGLKEYVMRKLTHNYHVSEFWADRNVSFTLEKGDMLGIIGANGAGKSTLLKVVSGIMEPSEGTLRREGNIAALLELGSGFDGDLTVRENTYLRGAMLGYTKKFMDDTYDEIIDFAELKDFQDRPFKQLSSGMKSRLAFSIASLVDPDILILDEVLSVGDGAFRKKSEDKMREIISGGATTILVSHSLGQVRELCNKVLWLHKGEQIAYGENVQEICDQYQKFLDGGMKPEDLPVREEEKEIPAVLPTVKATSRETDGQGETIQEKKKTRERTLRALLCGMAVLLLTAAIEWFYFGFLNVDFSAPINMERDALTGLQEIRGILNGGNTSLGWPYEVDFSAYSPRTYMLLWVFVKICGIFTKDVVLIGNLYRFGIPLLNVLVCYLVMRHFKVRAWLACLAALTFGFCPYVQARLPAHMNLATVECIPLAFMLCFWCLEDPAFERPGRGWFKYKRNWLALLFAWMIANNGHVYYPFFTCFILCVTALCQVLRERRLRAAAAPAVLIGQIVFWLAIDFIPSLVGMMKGYGNVAANGVSRGIGSGMAYMLRVNSLVLSPKGYGIGKLRDVITSFFQFAARNDSFYPNESSGCYMGIVAVIGFLILLAWAFSAGERRKSADRLAGRMTLLSKVTLGIIVLAVSTGLGTIVNIVIPFIRCYNRISPFLVFCGVFAVTLCLEALLRRYAAPAAGGVLLSVLAVGLFSYGLWEQQGIYAFFVEGSGETNKAIYETDERFVSEIEEMVGEDAMIFQLPYMRAFENGWLKNIQDYDHLRGTVHSDTLRWSYGAMIGSENDKWYKTACKLQPEELVGELYAQGFSGIWLNLDGYEAEEGAALEEELCAAAHCEETILCGDGHTVFIPLSQELYYTEGGRSGDVREIHYAAREENIRTILEELTGDEASVRWLEDTLKDNGTDGGTYTISLPADGAYQLHRKTPEEKGEMRAVAVVADGQDLALENVGDHQLVRIPFTIRENTLYKVELILAGDTSFETVEELVLDFYGGAAYDREEQQATRFTREGRYGYTFYFDSGEIDGGSIEGSVRAFVFDLSTEVRLDMLRVTEMELTAG